MNADRVSFTCGKASVHHEGLADIKHAIFHTSGLQPEVSSRFIDFNRGWGPDISELAGELLQLQSMSCMQDMLRVNIRQKLQVVIQIATKHSDILGSVKLIEMFEYFKTFEGDFHRM